MLLYVFAALLVFPDQSGLRVIIITLTRYVASLSGIDFL